MHAQVLALPPRSQKDAAPAESRSPADRHFVTALARGLDILACFRSGESSLSNQELARRCGLPKSTVSRLTQTLLRQGYLSHDRDTGKFRLGDATMALGGAALARLDMAQIARPMMQALADESRGMVSLAIPNRTSMLYLEVCRSGPAVGSMMGVGTRLPMVTSAIGRAYLAGIDDADRAEIMVKVRERKPECWETSREMVEQALREYRRLGCTCSFGAWQRGVNAIAVPVASGMNRPVVAINCGGPVSEMSQNYLLSVVRPRLLELSARLHTMLR
ncbi:IclR family transcriptional regulator [Verticiella sediminum]|uniref:IclR family transcriptional regulator n=1 Tax=Verticiella sediminum TaxID=1247510 RepID=A0A556ADP8_9BURK|nr:IclR family transcriptional regulator [Verticiella sediminum]TSH91018.1 IclR family transcriptional regulator [Verticiella sediminum]